MKKIVASLLCIFFFTFSSHAQNDLKTMQINLKDVQGTWTLKALEGNNSTKTLSPEEIKKMSENYLHDFPLKTTMFTLTGNNFTMTHHNSSSMTGTFDVIDQSLKLQTDIKDCSTCPSKTLVFIVSSFNSKELVLDIFDEDEGSTDFARLTLTK